VAPVARHARGARAQHGSDLVAIGNGTASRETEKLAAELIATHPELKLTKVVVSEAGASVYSASELASQEFPDVDVSIRGAISIAVACRIRWPSWSRSSPSRSVSGSTSTT
jgi:uncharacterized protein